MSIWNEPSPNSRLAKLEMAARLHHYDKTLEDAADLFDRDVAAWQKLPILLQDRSGQYRDSRAAYRRAVEATAVPDDRGPSAERTTS